MTLLKSIRRAFQPTAFKTAAVSCALLLPAIVSRIEKPVTLPAAVVAAAPQAIAPVVPAPAPVLAAPLVLPPVKSALKAARKRVSKKVVLPLVAAKVAPAKGLTKSPAPAAAPKSIDVQADLAELTPQKGPSQGGEDFVVAKADDKEKEVKEEVIEAAPESLTPAASIDQNEDRLVDALLSEEHHELEAINPVTLGETTAQTAASEMLAGALDNNFPNEAELHVAVQPPLPAELTNTQKEGEIQESDFSNYSLRLAELKGEWRTAKKEFQAALKGEAPAKVELVADAPAESATGPIVEMPAVAPAVAASTPAENAAKPEPTLVRPSPKKVDPIAHMAALKVNEPVEPPKEPELVDERTREEKELAAATEPQLVAASAHENDSEENNTSAGEPELVAPAPKPVVKAPVRLATQPKVTTQFAAMVPSVPSVPKIVFDATADIAALTGSAPKPVVVAAATVPSAAESLQDGPARAVTSGMPELTQKHITRTVQQATAAAEEAQENQDADSDAEADAEDALSTEGGQVNGRLVVDSQLNSWLDQYRGHIELLLKPVKSRIPADTIYFEPDEYSYPEEAFQFSTEGMEGSQYRLLAGFFVPGVKEAVAKIAFPGKISAETYRKRLQFKLNYRDFERALALQQNKARGLSMAVTIFEGASGDYKKPQSIGKKYNARIEIVGFPELKTFYANKRGNIVIPRVPSRSTLKIKAMADGFYDNYVTVATGSSEVYSPIYLISRDKVDAVTRHFTKKLQNPRKGVVMGRVFDTTKKRSPLAGEKVTLQYRKGRALYFKALPDTELEETQNNGLFGFYNVGSVFRTLTRSSSELPFLLNVPANSATYVELGRGGKKNFRGVISDPFHSEIPQAAVRFVGAGRGEEVLTGENNDFTIPGVDFPAGTVLVEVEMGDLTYWYDKPFNPRERSAQEKFTVFSRAQIESSASVAGKQKWKSNLGTVVGGASAEFFKGRNECISVTLENLSTAPLAPNSGPFPLRGERPAKGDVVCLNAKSPHFTFFNLSPGEYVLKWRNATGKTIRSSVVHAKPNRVSIAVD